MFRLHVSSTVSLSFYFPLYLHHVLTMSCMSSYVDVVIARHSDIELYLLSATLFAYENVNRMRCLATYCVYVHHRVSVFVLSKRTKCHGRVCGWLRWREQCVWNVNIGIERSDTNEQIIKVFRCWNCCWDVSIIIIFCVCVSSSSPCGRPSWPDAAGDGQNEIEKLSN